MAIYAYTGLPGSGKSYGVVANQIIPALKEGRRVVTNIPLHEDVIRGDIDTGELVDLPVERISAQPEMIEEYCTPGSVVVIDEVWRLFPAGQKVHHVPEQYKKLLAEHRHMVDEEGRSMVVVLVTQDLAQIGAFARQLVEQTFHHTKLGHLGAAGSYKCNIYHGCVTGANPPETNKLRGILGRYDKRVYQYYKSHTMSRSGTDGADERAIDQRGNVWKRPVIWVAAVFVIAGGIYAVHGISSFFGAKEPAPARASGATARPAPGPAASSRPVAMLTAQKSYRVSVIMASSDPAASYALLVDDQGAQVWISGQRCTRDRLEWRCWYDGAWWTLTAPWKPPVEDTRRLNPFSMPVEPQPQPST